MAKRDFSDIIRRAQTALRDERRHLAEARAKVKVLDPARFSASYIEETRRAAMADGKARAAAVRATVRDELEAARAEAEQYEPDDLLRVGGFFKAGEFSCATTTDRLLWRLLEATTETNWRARAATMREADLQEEFSSAVAERRFGVASLLLREADQRAQAAPDGMDGMATRTLPHLLRTELAEHPATAAAGATARELKFLGEYLDDAVTAFDSGEDRGLRHERMLLAQASGDREAMQAAALAPC